MALAFERAGSGPPLILLHGVGHRRQAWEAVIDRLTPHRDVVAVDLPGHGESPSLQANRPVLEEMLGEVIALLDGLGLERPHLAGNSLGGRLALQAAAAGRAASVTALSPAGFWRNDRETRYPKAIFTVLQVAASRLQHAAPAMSRTTVGRAVSHGAVVSRPSRLTAEQALGDMAAFLAARDALNAVLAQITPFTGQLLDSVPVTIAWGTRDRLLRPRQILMAKARLPQARLLPLPGCGHVPMTDDPPLVADVLLHGSSRGPARQAPVSDYSESVLATGVWPGLIRADCTVRSG
jgi:pimeloyl-ACP methyl ester carboxylesterase